MSLSLAAFVAAWNGLAADFDGAYGYQCEDIVQFFVRDVLALPPLSGNAVDAWRLPLPRGLRRIANGPHNFPAPGDIVVWGGAAVAGTGFNGHIAIALLADEMHLISFDQNFPTGSWCHMQPHGYDGVLGWLAPGP